MSIFSSRKKTETAVSSTSFSTFIREAPSKEKKRVYADVLKEATEMQNRIVRQARSVKK